MSETDDQGTPCARDRRGRGWTWSGLLDAARPRADLVPGRVPRRRPAQASPPDPTAARPRWDPRSGASRSRPTERGGGHRRHPQRAARELIARLRQRRRDGRGADQGAALDRTSCSTENVGIRDLRRHQPERRPRSAPDRHRRLGDRRTTCRVERVLVTGAGGSIGSELCRQIDRYGPGRADHARPRRVGPARRAALDPGARTARLATTSCCATSATGDALLAVFKERRPEVVFHAAALKHLPMLEQYPAEAVKTNVVGTQNVLDAAELVGIERVRQHLDRQGGQPQQRPRLLQAARRADHRQPGRSAPGTLPVGPLRQRPRAAAGRC